MNLNIFRKIIDEIAAFPDNVKEKDIELFHFGESLFHPHILEMIQYTSQSGLRPVLSINPANLTQQHIDLIPESQPAKVIISLDTLNQETYREIRGSQADLGLAIQNAERLLKSCQKYNTEIVIRMIVMWINHEESDHFRKFWEQRGGQVQFRDFFPWNKKDLASLGRFKQYPPYMPCPFPWQYMVVHWNGDVVPCCRDCNGDMVLGNVIDQSLQEIWVSKEYEAFRERMMNGTNLPDCCKECLSLYYRET